MCFQAEPIQNSQNEYLRGNKGFADITCFFTQGIIDIHPPVFPSVLLSIHLSVQSSIDQWIDHTWSFEALKMGTTIRQNNQ